MKKKERAEMKMLLFLSFDENPLWKKELIDPAEKSKKERFLKILKVSPQVNAHWERGERLLGKTTRNVFEHALAEIAASEALSDARRKQLHDRVVAFRDKHFNNDDAHVYDAAICLEIDPTIAQRHIDQSIGLVFPLFKELHYASLDAANEAFKTYRGVFHVWAWTNNGILQCALRVRYPLPSGKGWILRCKLNLPPRRAEVAQKGKPKVKDEQPKDREYDGYLVVRPRMNQHLRAHLFWIFEARKAHGDYLFCVTTDKRDFEQQPTFLGSYLGPAYADITVPAYAGAVLIQHSKTVKDPPFDHPQKVKDAIELFTKIRAFMKNEVKEIPENSKAAADLKDMRETFAKRLRRPA